MSDPPNPDRDRAPDSPSVVRTMLDAVPAAIWYKDLDNNILAVNSKAAELEGIEAHEIAGRSCWDLYPREQAVAFFDDDLEVIRSGRPKLGIVEPHSTVGSGELRWLEVSKVPVRDSSDQIVGVVAMAVDVTEKRRLEDALRTSQRLESLAVLAGGLAHDYNNLFAAVFGSIDRARGCPDCGPEASRYLSHAAEAIGRARALTSQLLTFGKGGEPAREPVDLVRLTDAAVRFALSGSGVRCEQSMPPDLSPCTGDESQLLQVLDNLLINARQAMNDRGVVRITGTDVAEGRPRPDLVADTIPLVRLDIEDDGPGIPVDRVRRIFDPFFTTRDKGTGLGLTVAWSVVKRHGGHIDVGRAPGGGARFSIWLPASSEKTPSNAAESGAGSLRSGELAGRVLVMDDDPMVLDVVTHMLEQIGFEVDAVGDGAAALERLQAAQSPDSAYLFGLVDLTTPGHISGLELARSAGRVPLIAMSGYTESAAMIEPEEHGFAARLAKPFLTADLERVAHRVLADAAGGRRGGPT